MKMKLKMKMYIYPPSVSKVADGVKIHFCAALPILYPLFCFIGTLDADRGGGGY